MTNSRQGNGFRQSDVLLVVPPSAWLIQPSLACHVLQGCAREKGFEVSVLYANVMFASLIGEEYYSRLMDYSRTHALVDRTFGIQAFGMPALTEEEKEILPEPLKDLEAKIETWLDWVGDIVREVRPKIVGCTSSYEQTAAGMAVFVKCKQIDPGIVTIMGGANCEDEMAEGIHSLRGPVDHVASGESEKTFPQFLNQVLVEKSRPDRIIYGSPCENLDALPTPEYWEFFDQYRQFIPDSECLEQKLLAVPYETSRGCWWGQKHHCTFCGLNGFGMAFREKSKEKALEEFKHLVAEYPIRRINTVDNIMPHKYFGDFLDGMAEAMPKDLYIFYEQKANISLDKAIQLRKARIMIIQPGIESIDSDLLRIMDKGVRAYQNIALLRYSRSLGIRVLWNLLSNFPGDSIASYKKMLEMIPSLHHLQPPKGPCRIIIDRFSPFFTRPQNYGIQNVRPKPYYENAFPDHADLPKLAYHFDGDFESECDRHPDLMAALKEAILLWRDAWEDPEKPKPALSIVDMFGSFVLKDTRSLNKGAQHQFLEEEEVAVLLAGANLDQRESPIVKRALDNRWLWEMDGRFVPLATAGEELLKKYDSLPKKQALDNVTGWKPAEEVPVMSKGLSV